MTLFVGRLSGDERQSDDEQEDEQEDEQKKEEEQKRAKRSDERFELQINLMNKKCLSSRRREECVLNETCDDLLMNEIMKKNEERSRKMKTVQKEEPAKEARVELLIKTSCNRL